MHNLEIKSAVPDPVALRRAVELLPARFEGILEQRDTYFVVPTGRLKLREIAGNPSELIAYIRGEEGKERVSDFEIFRLTDPETLTKVLSKTLGIRAVVEKRRELFMFGETRIHLDEVKQLGHFLEFEIPHIPGEEAKSNEILTLLKRELNLNSSNFINGSYIDLILAKNGM